MIKNIDLCVQIPGLSRTSTKIPELSRLGIQILKFKDFPGFEGPVLTLILDLVIVSSSKQMRDKSKIRKKTEIQQRKCTCNLGYADH